MIEVKEPEVYLISEPIINVGVMNSYLKEVGGIAWLDSILLEEDGAPHDAELLVEFAGRLCYKSWAPGLNKNVTKIRKDHGDYLLNVLRSGHGSVLEHANFSFMIHDASRVLTAELNRHRAGVAISEQSLRYVRLDELRFRVPPNLKPKTQQAMKAVVEGIEVAMSKLMEMEDLDNPDLDFAEKKAITSALRRLAPMGILTDEMWTGNIRTIRHVISMRSAEGAEEEIRIFADKLAQLMQKKCPLLFGDYEVVDGVWKTDNWKV